LLEQKDQLKFVICHREDYDWARSKLNQYQLNDRCEVLFSPIHGELKPADLADWIVEDNLPVRMQLQLHKYLWGDEQGR
jgi:7-carboxy-7-deazaguanine synthase